ncbi:hypothetical protein CVT26_002450 [Gymnopilus dilepis]|uniref:Uncharacterized protein n=1 Tax=Gymnopilus dilepis TaxID=231916 RepID=A0A409VT18_9AGAR|nr:hypothetical protein CVT26_002450 [Gymnopilus dilepis]
MSSGPSQNSIAEDKQNFSTEQVHDLFYNGLREPFESIFNEDPSRSSEPSNANTLGSADLAELSESDSVQPDSPLRAPLDDEIDSALVTDDEVSSEIEPMSSPLGASTITPSPSSEGISPSLQKKKTHSFVQPRATMRNPIHGLVQGVKKGNKSHVTYRTHRLPSPRISALDVSRRYHRQINKLLQRCEDLSTETGCWLFFAAQHVTAREGAISYASPRLRREALEQAERIATDFNTTAARLRTSRRVEAVQLSEQLEEVERQRLAAEAAFQEAKARIAELEASAAAVSG